MQHTEDRELCFYSWFRVTLIHAILDIEVADLMKSASVAFP